MFRLVVFGVLVVVTCLTVATHIWWIPALQYPLLLGTLAHTAATPDSLAGATDAHGGTLKAERIGFVLELLTNVAGYFLLTMVGARLWTVAAKRNSKPTTPLSC